MKYRKATISSLAVALCLTTAGCGGRGTTEKSSSGDADAVVSVDGCQNYDGAAGVTDDKIILGSSFPSSGPLATLAQLADGYEAYFDYANAELGGVDGKDIEVVSYDDGYDPSRTVTNVNKLVSQDKALALVGVPSTAGNFAFWDRTETSCVPNLMASTGAADFKATREHQWSLSGQFPYRLEAQALAHAMSEDHGVKTVAVLYQAGDFGEAFLDGLEAASGDLGLKIVAKESFQATDPSVTTQVTSLASSGADAALVVAAGTPCAQALDAIGKTSWKPLVAESYTCTSKSLMTLADPAASQGVLSVTPFKDPASPRWANDAEMSAYRDAVRKYRPKADEDDSFVANGWFYGETVYNILKNADELTRQGVMSSALSLDALSTSTTLPGVVLNTSVDDPTLIEGVQVQQYDSTAKDWVFLDGANVLPDGKTAIVEYEYAATE